MVTRQLFDEVIKDILSNLYDVAALETHPTVFSVISMPSSYIGSRGEYVRQLMLEAIEQLRPARKELSITSTEWRPYLILSKRYVEGVGVQELSELLAISPRQMRRDHHKALQTLTDILWTTCYPAESAENKPEQNPIIEVHNEIIDPLETARGVYALLRKQFEMKGIHVDFIQNPESVPVISDRVILRQVLISLFNDILHDQVDKRLVICCEAVEKQVYIKFSSQLTAGWEPSAEGTEDDLSSVQYWCKSIQARIEHKLSIDGNNRGIDRILWLPHLDQKVLLVIDDQDAVVNLFKRYLSQTDILTIGVNYPEKAISLAQHLQPALITLDVMMPQIDGWELLQLIKLDDRLKEIPVVVCSAWDDPDLSRSLGAAAYLKKPVTQKMLLDVVHQLIS